MFGLPQTYVQTVSDNPWEPNCGVDCLRTDRQLNETKGKGRIGLAISAGAPGFPPRRNHRGKRALVFRAIRTTAVRLTLV